MTANTANTANIDDVIDDIIGRARDTTSWRRVETCRLYKPALLEAHSELELLLESTIADDVEQNRTARAPKIADRIVELEEEIESSVKTYRVGSLTFRGYNELLAAHPPTRAQLKDHVARSGDDWRTRTVLDHNPDTFRPALISACSIEPELSVQEANDLEDELPPDQLDLLYQTCLALNRQGNQPPKSLPAGAIRRLNGQSEDIAARGESPEASS